MKITVIGTGYVGLVTGTCFADLGNDVLCLDIDAEKINALNDGRIPIYEPGLEELVRNNREDGRLDFTTDIDRAVAHGKLQFIAVGTPPGEDGSCDLQYVLDAARNIGERMKDFRLVINKSTVPVGTADRVRQVISEALHKRGENIPFEVASNPEFLKEGAAVKDFMRPDRIIVGTESDQALKLMQSVYAPLNRNHDRLMAMSTRSAELTKYAANAMLATRISFMNELANLAEHLDADIEEVRQGIGSDPRIGYDFLYSGCGFGGSCFPKDIRALGRTAHEQTGAPLKILEAVTEVNDRQKRVLFDKIARFFDGDVEGRRFAIWGLTFKPNTDDLREASSLVLIDQLTNAGAAVTAYDPEGMEAARKLFDGRNGIAFGNNAMTALDGADALVIVTEWREFRSPDFDEIRKRLKQPAIFDGRNLFDPQEIHALGFHYEGIGRLYRPNTADQGQHLRKIG